MIRLMSSSYNTEDFLALRAVIEDASIYKTCQNKANCVTCPHKNACYDIQRLLVYLQKKVANITDEE